MTKTIRPLLSHYSSTKWRKGRGRLFETGRLFEISAVLIRGGRLFEGGGGGANSKINGSPYMGVPLPPGI